MDITDQATVDLGTDTLIPVTIEDRARRPLLTVMRPSDWLLHCHQSHRIAASRVPTAHDLQRIAQFPNKVRSLLADFLHKTTGNSTTHMPRNRRRANGPMRALDYPPAGCLISTKHRDQFTTLHRRTSHPVSGPDHQATTNPVMRPHRRAPAKGSARLNFKIVWLGFRSLEVWTLVVQMRRADHTIRALSPELSSRTRDIRQVCPLT